MMSCLCLNRWWREPKIYVMLFWDGKLKIQHLKFSMWRKSKLSNKAYVSKQRFKSREGKQKFDNMTKNEYIFHVESKLRCDHAIQDLIMENYKD